ncbi:Medium/long-chain-fatty-acid--[acyl-carrier-protein] ligase MbtM [Euphorbia peplus]|nr:Medium/long-chain-fatty-acid--[acyl-carrier-protein] ligase MbtM [Euphorbia peplus]
MNYENYDPSFPDQPVVDLYLPIWASLPVFKSKPAFIWADSNSSKSDLTSILTYSQLNDSVTLISTGLLNSLSRSETIVVLCPPGLELVEMIFGCQRAGLTSIPIFPLHPSFTNHNYHHLLRVLSQTNPSAAIANAHYITQVQNYINSSSSNPKLVGLLKNLKWISTHEIKNGGNLFTQSSKDEQIRTVNRNLKKPTRTKPNLSETSYNGCKPNDVYLIQYTSGATGIPKPVLVTAGSAVHNVRVARKAYDLHPNSVIASWLPQYHDCGLQFLLLTVISGATCVLASPVAFISRPRLWLELISDFKATCTPVPSFALPLVVKRGGVGAARSRILSLSSMKNLIIINEPIYKASVEEFINVFRPFGLNPSSISPSYGLAENCTFVSTSWRSHADLNSNLNFNLPAYKKLLPVSRLNFQNEEDEEDMEIVIVNEETDELVADGIEGAIWVSSPSNCRGYLGHPNLTREIFQARLKNKLSRCFVRTGDRGIIQGNERFLYVTGRCSDVIRLENRGEIHPHYIENAAQNSSRKVIRGGCLAAFEMGGKIILVAELQVREENGVALRRICEGVRRGVMEEEGVEIGVVVLVKSGSVPKTTSGKIQRWAVKNKYIEGKMGKIIEVVFDNEEEIKMGKRVIAQNKESYSRISNSPSLISHL